MGNFVERGGLGRAKSCELRGANFVSIGGVVVEKFVLKKWVAVGRFDPASLLPSQRRAREEGE